MNSCIIAIGGAKTLCNNKLKILTKIISEGRFLWNFFFLPNKYLSLTIFNFCINLVLQVEKMQSGVFFSALQDCLAAPLDYALLQEVFLSSRIIVKLVRVLQSLNLWRKRFFVPEFVSILGSFIRRTFKKRLLWLLGT